MGLRGCFGWCFGDEVDVEGVRLLGVFDVVRYDTRWTRLMVCRCLI